MKLRNLLFAKLRLTDNLARPFSDGLDWSVFILALIIGSVFAVYTNHIGVSMILVDQFSHLSIARQITDSLTPGMSQVGFWPPLLHVIIAPFAVFDSLYYSGYAAACILVPLLGLAIVWLARLLFLLTDVRSLSYGFALLFLINPYVLYFSVTPMMEILFLAMLFGATYYFTRWWLTGELSALIFTGALISLSSVSRFEGFILIPLVTMLIAGKLFFERTKFSQIEAAIFIFGLIAATGVMFTLAYGTVYNGNPLAFMSNSWGAYAQQRDLNLPAEGSVINAFVYMGAAAVEMLGALPLIIMLLSLLFLLVMPFKQKTLTFAIASILLSPFLFDILAAYQGSAVIYLPYLWPYPDGYFNARYGLLLAGAVIVLPALAASLLAKLFHRANTWQLGYSLPAVYLAIFMLVGTASFAFEVGCSTCFEVVQKSQQLSPKDHAESALALKENYDGGYVLMTRALHNEIAVRAEIPLSHYILEANEHYYGRAVEAPWWYARYVVMFNPSEAIHQDWQRENEQVSRMWAGNATFNQFYEQIFLSDGEAVYKIRDHVLREHALLNGLDPEVIPSLRTATDRWDVEETYTTISNSLAVTSPPDIVNSL